MYIGSGKEKESQEVIKKGHSLKDGRNSLRNSRPSLRVIKNFIFVGTSILIGTDGDRYRRMMQKNPRMRDMRVTQTRRLATKDFLRAIRRWSTYFMRRY